MLEALIVVVAVTVTVTDGILWFDEEGSQGPRNHGKIYILVMPMPKPITATATTTIRLEITILPTIEIVGCLILLVSIRVEKLPVCYLNILGTTDSKFLSSSKSLGLKGPIGSLAFKVKLFLEKGDENNS